MRSSGAMLLSSAATSSCAIALSSASFASCERYSKTVGGVLARQHAEDDDLVLEAQLGQQRGERRRRGGCASCRAAARSRGRAAPRRARRPAVPTWRIARERLVALRAVELLFHLRQRGSDDVVVVDVRADGLDGVEPERGESDRDRRA